MCCSSSCKGPSSIRISYASPPGISWSDFNRGGGRLILTWYLFAVSALLLVPVAVLVHQVLAGEASPYLAVGTTIGVVAGLVQFLGLIRWPFLVPFLARTHSDRASSQSTRDAVAVVFQAFHRYAGMAVGEHLGYLCTSVWTAFIALALAQSASFSSWIGWVGLVPAAGIFVGLFEEAGFKPVGAINAISYVLWSIWLIIVGVAFLLH